MEQLTQLYLTLVHDVGGILAKSDVESDAKRLPLPQKS
jgi:hypothetical protein